MDGAWHISKHNNTVVPQISNRLSLHKATAPLQVHQHHDISSDGIGSPTDTAYTPPGVLTKVDNLVKNKLSIQKQIQRMICSSCTKKAQCYCKQCTLQKLSFYAKKQRISLKLGHKEELRTEINKVLNDSATLATEENKTREKVMKLREAVENAKLRIEIKKREWRNTHSAKTDTRFQEIFDMLQIKIHEFKNRNEKLTNMLRGDETKLAELRRNMCIAACRIFPIQEVEVDVEAIVQNSSSNRRWAMVNDNVDVGRRYQIRSAYINDASRQRLSESLSGGALSLPHDLHPAFASVFHTVQLVQLFNYIFNIGLPFEFSHKDMCSRDRWSKEILEFEWQKLCDAVIWLCANVGLEASKLESTRPHENLMEFANFVVSEKGDITKIGNQPLSNLSVLRRSLSFKEKERNISREEEEDGSWYFVD